MEKQILICCGTGCRANGSMKVAEALSEAAKAKGAKAQVIAEVKTTGCNGFCENGPIVKIMPDNLVYYKVKPKDAEEIIEKTVLGEKRSSGSCIRMTAARGYAPRKRIHSMPISRRWH